MKRAFVAAAILVAGLTAWTGTASAVQEKTPYHCTETLIAYDPFGTLTDTGQVTHLTGQHVFKQATGDLYCAGIVEIWAEFQINNQLLTTVGHGTYRVVLDGIDGGFDVSWQAHGVISPSFAFTGTTVGHGFGELTGWQLRGTTTRSTTGQFTDDGFVFQPGN